MSTYDRYRFWQRTISHGLPLRRTRCEARDDVQSRVFVTPEMTLPPSLTVLPYRRCGQVEKLFDPLWIRLMETKFSVSSGVAVNA